MTSAISPEPPMVFSGAVITLNPAVFSYHVKFPLGQIVTMTEPRLTARIG